MAERPKNEESLLRNPGRLSRCGGLPHRASPLAAIGLIGTRELLVAIVCTPDSQRVGDEGFIDQCVLASETGPMEMESCSSIQRKISPK